ncbi:MAG: hypothetical protein ABSG25_02345 [Bryobacteraceae bacterium]
MGKDLEYEVALISNGMVENYPKVVYMRTIRVKHIRDLIFASEQTEDVYGKVLTSVLDSLINFERTGFIKTSDELSMIDRQKLVVWQRVNSKGLNYTIPFTCPKCEEESENTFSIKDMDEIKLKSKIVNKTIKYFVNEDENDFSFGNYYELILGFPTRKDYLRIKGYIDSYKKDVFKNIDSLLYITEINNLEELKKKIKIDDNKAIFDKLKEKSDTKTLRIGVDENAPTYTDEIGTIKRDSKTEIDGINDKINIMKEKRKDNKKEIEDILNKYDLKVDLEDDIKTSDDLYFEGFYEYLLMLGCCLKNDFTNYVEFILNLRYLLVGEIEKFMKVCYHTIENKVIYRCPKCRYTSKKEELQFTADFFLR